MKKTSFKREIVKRQSYPTGTIRMHEPSMRVVRTLSCGHTQEERNGGLASKAVMAFCKTCEKQAAEKPPCDCLAKFVPDGAAPAIHSAHCASLKESA